jgi:hypothetical protein
VDLTQMSAIFNHSDQIQILKMFSTASLEVTYPPFFHPLEKASPYHFVAIIKFHVTTQFLGPTLTEEPRVPPQTQKLAWSQ